MDYLFMFIQIASIAIISWFMGTFLHRICHSEKFETPVSAFDYAMVVFVTVVLLVILKGM